jgi:hypothetical protein
MQSIRTFLLRCPVELLEWFEDTADSRNLSTHSMLISALIAYRDNHASKHCSSSGNDTVRTSDRPTHRDGMRDRVVS